MCLVLSLLGLPLSESLHFWTGVLLLLRRSLCEGSQMNVNFSSEHFWPIYCQLEIVKYGNRSLYLNVNCREFYLISRTLLTKGESGIHLTLARDEKIQQDTPKATHYGQNYKRSTPYFNKSGQRHPWQCGKRQEIQHKLRRKVIITTRPPWDRVKILTTPPPG